VRLYTFLHSPNPLKVRLALAELALPYEAVEVNLFKGEHRADAFAKVNPHQKVPVLDDGQVLLPESNAILSYLGKTRGGALWPADVAGEANALRWLFLEAGHISPHAGKIWWSDVVAPAMGRPGADKATVADAVEEIERALHFLDKHLAAQPFLLGDDLSLVDCSVGVSVAMLRKTRLDDAARWPSLHAYRERLRARPSWSASCGDAIHDLA
jgi:glutathione S-transferase